MALSILAGPVCTRTDENKLDIDGDGGISGGKVNDRIENLSRSTKVKKSSGTDFLTSEAKKTFSCLWKAFTKARFLGILIQNPISESSPILQDMLLVESLTK